MGLERRREIVGAGGMDAGSFFNGRRRNSSCMGQGCVERYPYFFLVGNPCGVETNTIVS